jgi:hypothetical protein
MKQLNLFDDDVDDMVFMDEAFEEDARRQQELEEEMWAILDAEQQQEEDNELELWAYIEEENEKQHSEELEAWFDVMEENGCEMFHRKDLVQME